MKPIKLSAIHNYYFVLNSNRCLFLFRPLTIEDEIKITAFGLTDDKPEVVVVDR